MYHIIRLRDRLQQVEEQEQNQEMKLDGLKDELDLTKEINVSQEQTILNLQEQIAQLGSSDERKKQETKVCKLLFCFFALIWPECDDKPLFILYAFIVDYSVCH